jgi:hypothetical protein
MLLALLTGPTGVRATSCGIGPTREVTDNEEGQKVNYRTLIKTVNYNITTVVFIRVIFSCLYNKCCQEHQQCIDCC